MCQMLPPVLPTARSTHSIHTRGTDKMEGLIRWKKTSSCRKEHTQHNALSRRLQGWLITCWKVICPSPSKCSSQTKSSDLEENDATCVTPMAETVGEPQGVNPL